MTSVRENLLPFKIELDDNDDTVTSHAGLPLVLEALRMLITKKQWRRLRNALGYPKRWKTVRRHFESLALLVASGGRNLDDLHVLRADAGLERLLGFRPSSPTQAKDFLYRFDQAEGGELLSRAQSRALSVRGEARIRAEGPALRLLDALLGNTVARVQQRLPRLRATIDVDATIAEANKQSALKAYEGTVGYQPQMAYWAEQGVWVADEFRDGNVPAEFHLVEFLQRVFAALPQSVRQRRLRGDSALYNEAALSWADDEGIEFAVSADMSPSLRAAATRLPESAWGPYGTQRERTVAAVDEAEERQCAEVVDFVPDWRRNRRKDGTAFRYIAIRVRSRQRDLFDDQADAWRHFAVVTNMDWQAERLLRWQREKQGTVEHAHGVLKNGLAAGTLPCGRFGSNAAWWRINTIVANVLELLKALALPPELSRMRPKGLRFRVFNLAGRITRSARRMVLHLSSHHPYAAAIVRARRVLAELAAAPRPPVATP